MSNETVARRYSAALADVVLKSGETDSVKAELSGWATLLAANPDLTNVFSNPAISHSNKEKVLDQLVAKTKPTRSTANFLKVLLQNGRLADLPEINTRFDSVLQDRRGIVSAEITSARELTTADRADLESNLTRMTGKEVKVDYKIDPEIIGGTVTRIGSTVYDGSVKTKLENLKEQLVKG